MRDATDDVFESASESASASDNAFESEIESESEREHVASEAHVPARMSDDESEAERVPVSEFDEPERMSDGDDDSDENKHDEMPSLSPTRSKLIEAMGGMDEGEYDNMMSDEIVSESDEIVNESDDARSGEPRNPLSGEEASAPVNDSTEVNSSSDDDDEYEVDSILTFRRVGKKRGKIEYLTKWVGGEESWEPAGSFRLDRPDSDDSGNTHLPVFEKFRSRMAGGQVSEFTGSDSGEAAGGESASVTLDDDIQNDMLNAMSNRIRILKTIIKGGIEVPQNRRQALKSALWSDFSKAEHVEIDAFSDLDVWELVDRPSNANVVGVRWVYDVKVDEFGVVQRYKARLVAQGFSQKEGIDYNETFAPTMHVKTARMLLAIAARDNVRVRQYDVSTAFLHADLAETVYVRQPEGHVVKGKERKVYRLKKAMYGLKNAPKAYSDHFMGILAQLGFTQSKKDECLWFFKRGKSYVYYLFHVDDIMVVSNNDGMREMFLNELQKRLKIRDEGDISMFLAMKIDRKDDGSYTMSQSHYIERMAEKFNVNDNTKCVETPTVYGSMLNGDMCPATSDEKIDAAKLPYQSLVGGLIYVAKTRPDVSFAISDVARFMSCWGAKHFKAALRILMYLFHTRDKCIHIKPDKNDFVLSAFSDANWCDPRGGGDVVDDKYKPQYGFVVFVSGVPVAWTSRRMQSRARSSMESEYYAADETCKEVLFWRDLLDEIGHKQTKPTQIYEDNMACIAYSKNNTCHARTKHIDNRAYILRDHVRDGMIELLHVDTNSQLADMMTKAQLKHTFIEHTNRIFSGACTPSEPTKGGAKVGVCHCLSCFVGGAVCEKSVWFDPILSFDPDW